jgi:serine/threonine protein kinase
LVGTVLGGRYELREKIGSGGMADVYLAHCGLLDRQVAVKILKEEFSRDKNFVHKFRTEDIGQPATSLTPSLKSNNERKKCFGYDKDCHFSQRLFEGFCQNHTEDQLL